MQWAMNDAPVETPVHVVILLAMAERCNDDGTDTRQSVATIAAKARVSTRTVHRELKTLEEMGIIRRGDQSKTEHLPSNRRPVVYDLAVELCGDNMAPQDDSGVTDTAVRGDTPALWGDTTGNLGVTRMADNKSRDKSGIGPVKGPGRASRSATTFPDSLVFTEEERREMKAKYPALDLRSEFEKFEDYHRAKGSKFADWKAAFRTWTRRADSYLSKAVAGVPIATNVPPEIEAMYREQGMIP